MASFDVRRTWEVDGVLTDLTSIVLRDKTGVFGVKRADTGAAAYPAGTPFPRLSAGVYEFTATGLVSGIVYIVGTEIVHGGQTYHFETTHVATDDTTPIVTADEVLAELGMSSPTAVESAVVANAVIKAQGAVRAFIGYDPALAQRTEFHPQQNFQAQISRGIWEVMEQRAVLRMVSESATNELQLRHIPVRSVAHLYVDYDGRSGTRPGAFGAGTERIEGQDYWPNYDAWDGAGNKVCTDGILRTIGLWPTTANTIKAIYTAGYSAAELRGGDPVLNATPIWEVALVEAVRRARRVLSMQYGSLGLPAGLKQSESIGEYSYNLEQRSIASLMQGGIAQENIAALQPFVNYGYALGS